MRFTLAEVVLEMEATIFMPSATSLLTIPEVLQASTFAAAKYLCKSTVTLAQNPQLALPLVSLPSIVKES